MTRPEYNATDYLYDKENLRSEYNAELSPEENTGRALFAIARALQGLNHNGQTAVDLLTDLGDISHTIERGVDAVERLVDTGTALVDAVDRGNE